MRVVVRVIGRRRTRMVAMIYVYGLNDRGGSPKGYGGIAIFFIERRGCVNGGHLHFSSFNKKDIVKLIC